MPVTVSERPESPQYSGGDNPTWELTYNIEGTDDSIQARLELLYQTPGIYDNLVRQVPRVERVGPGFFYGSMTYGKRKNESGQIEYEFEIGGKTEKIYQSIATRRYGQNAPDYQGAIGVVKNGDQIDVQGVEIYVPTKSFSLKCRFPPSIFTPAYENAIYLCTVAPVNQSPFYGYQAGELLFKGSTGGYKSGDEYGEISFKFDASPNMTGLSVGDIGGIEKKGWEQVDIVREVQKQGSSLIPKAVGVYVHQVYHASDFSILGIN
jgi:hypothetical protein